MQMVPGKKEWKACQHQIAAEVELVGGNRARRRSSKPTLVDKLN